MRSSCSTVTGHRQNADDPGRGRASEACAEVYPDDSAALTRTVSAGLPHSDKRFALPPVQLVAEERILRGSYIGSAVPARDIPRYIDMYRCGKLPVDRLMGEYLQLADINRGFDRLASGQPMRDMILF